MVDTGEAELVREIFQLRLQGQGSYRIARLLTLRGIKTKHGHSSWSPKVIVGIHSNTAYIGRLYFGKYQHVEPESRRKPINLKNPHTSVQTTPREQWLEIPVPSIIDQETFDTVTRRFRPRSNSLLRPAMKSPPTIWHSARVVEMLDLRIIYQDREHWHSTFCIPAEYGLEPAEVFGESSSINLSQRTTRRW